MVKIKYFITFSFFIFILNGCQKNKNSTIKSIKDNVSNYKEKKTINIEIKSISKINLRELFEEDISFYSIKSDSITLFNKYKGKSRYISSRGEIILYFDCILPILERKKSFKFINKYEWIEGSLIHKDYYYITDKFVVIYEYVNRKNFIIESPCSKIPLYKDAMYSIRIYKKDEYFEQSDKSNSSYLLMKSKDTVN